MTGLFVDARNKVDKQAEDSYLIGLYISPDLYCLY